MVCPCINVGLHSCVMALQQGVQVLRALRAEQCDTQHCKQTKWYVHGNASAMLYVATPWSGRAQLRLLGANAQLQVASCACRHSSTTTVTRQSQMSVCIE